MEFLDLKKEWIIVEDAVLLMECAYMFLVTLLKWMSKKMVCNIIMAYSKADWMPFYM